MITCERVYQLSSLLWESRIRSRYQPTPSFTGLLSRLVRGRPTLGSLSKIEEVSAYSIAIANAVQAVEVSPRTVQ